MFGNDKIDNWSVYGVQRLDVAFVLDGKAVKLALFLCSKLRLPI